MLKNRPCGVCRALVPVDTGCPHWKPAISAGKRRGWVKGRARSTADVPAPSVTPPPLPDTPHPIEVLVPCDCDKEPGPPFPHKDECAKLRARRVLTARQGAR